MLKTFAGGTILALDPLNLLTYYCLLFNLNLTTACS